MWKDSPSSDPRRVGLGEAVDAAEVQGLVADVELLQPGQAGAHDDVALGAGLEGAPPTEVEHALEHLARIAPHGLEAVVGAVQKLLLILQIGMVRHRAPFSPRPSGKRFSLDAGRDDPGGRPAMARTPTMTAAR